jgi:hypothetical protein
VKEKRKYRRICDGGPEGLKTILAEYQSSGLTQRQYALKAGMGYSTLTKRLRQARGAGESVKCTPAFIAVKAAAIVRRASYQIQLPGGINLQLEPGFDPREVGCLLSLLSPCSR